MAYYSETDNYDEGLRQIETSDQAIGGTTGALATIFKSIANRTNWLKIRVNRMLLGEVLAKGNILNITTVNGAYETTVNIGSTISTAYHVKITTRSLSLSGGAIDNYFFDAVACMTSDHTPTTFKLGLDQIHYTTAGGYESKIDVSWELVSNV